MSRIKRSYLSILLVPVILATGVFSVAGFFRSLRSAMVAQSTTAAAANVNEPLENIRFTIYDVGIYPQEIEVNARRLGIVFDDRTGAGSDFVVQRMTENTPQQVAQIRPVPNRPRTRGEVKLTPGRYRVFDSARPEIFSTLIVSP